jgi:hypothetical protein
VAIYTPCSSIFFLLVIFNGRSPLVLMSGPKRNPPYGSTRAGVLCCVFYFLKLKLKETAPRMTAREAPRAPCEGGKMPHGRSQSSVKEP